ncbi:hypothetical protein [Undibacterium sp. TS12]|uniref:hypothetical protein n=1 Tax=Undibacterium sp. TS12 TaxID=2908202 RepID=UPI001F4CF12A|nr:hypothetical protein [Undibacterium sp. TS12]MCH8619703.1 hypothetical protein [Undibacterium sp. TS12]
MFNKIKNKISQLRVKSIIFHSPHRQALSEIPDAVMTYWQIKAKKEFPGIPSDAVFFIRAAEGLMEFFECVKRSKRPCALPSKAADSVWHVWNSWSSINLDCFCQKHFGCTIPHVEAEKMDGPLDLALAATLVETRYMERLMPASVTVTRLFALDRKLKMPGGFAYKISRQQVGFQNMNERGKGKGHMIFPASFSIIELAAAGLITAEVYEEAMRQQAKAQAAANSGGSSCGSGFSDSGGSSSCDAGSGDCGGSSCGSSCGGGCGGGCGS